MINSGIGKTNRTATTQGDSNQGATAGVLAPTGSTTKRGVAQSFSNTDPSSRALNAEETAQRTETEALVPSGQQINNQHALDVERAVSVSGDQVSPQEQPSQEGIEELVANPAEHPLVVEVFPQTEQGKRNNLIRPFLAVAAVLGVVGLTTLAILLQVSTESNPDSVVCTSEGDECRTGPYVTSLVNNTNKNINITNTSAEVEAVMPRHAYPGLEDLIENLYQGDSYVRMSGHNLHDDCVHDENGVLSHLDLSPTVTGEWRCVESPGGSTMCTAPMTSYEYWHHQDNIDPALQNVTISACIDFSRVQGIFQVITEDPPHLGGRSITYLSQYNSGIYDGFSYGAYLECKEDSQKQHIAWGDIHVFRAAMFHAICIDPNPSTFKLVSEFARRGHLNPALLQLLNISNITVG